MNCWRFQGISAASVCAAAMLSAALLSTTVGCGNGGDSLPDASIKGGENSSSSESARAAPVVVRGGADQPAASPVSPKKEAPREVLLHTSQGDIRIRLFHDKAPVTVENFLRNYVDRGAYDNTVFHYVEKDFMIAAGGYNAEYKPIPPRADIRNEAHNGLKNRRGAVAMARHPDFIHSAASQFFINLQDNPGLDYRKTEQSPDEEIDAADEAEDYGYCVFGQVIEGMDVVDRIAKAKVENSDEFPSHPAEAIIVLTARRPE